MAINRTADIRRGTRTGKIRTLSTIFLILYLLLSAGFLLEAALPADGTADQTVPIATWFASLFGRGNCRITTDDGADIQKVTLSYDSEKRNGEVIRLHPSGGSEIESLTSLTPEICTLHKVQSGSQNVWLLAVHSTGVGRLSLSTATDGVVTTRTFTLNIREKELPSAGERTLTLSLPVVKVGDRLTASYGAEGTTTESAVTIEASDAAILAPVSADPGRASTEFHAKEAGDVTLTVRSLISGEILAEQTLSVGAANEDLSLMTADGTPLSGISLLCYAGSGYGHPVRLATIGSGITIGITGDSLRLISSGGEAGGTRYLIPITAGESVVTLRSESGKQLDYHLNVIAAPETAPGDTAVTPTVDITTPMTGDLITVRTGTDRPIRFLVSGDALNLYQEDLITGEGKFTALAAGTSVIEIRDALTDALLSSLTLTVSERPVGNNTSFYKIVRKGIGHFSWCAAIGFCFFFAFFFRLRLPLFSVIGVASGAAIAAVSEWIQAFTPGRSCLFTDMLIDFSGCLIGILFPLALFFLCRLLRKRTPNKDVL